MSIDYWVFLPASWILLGVVLCIVEMIEGNMLALPSGVAALLLSILLALQVGEITPESMRFGNWKHVLLAYSCLVLASVTILRKVFLCKKKDINDY